jgi:hypothetical protein
MAVLVAVLRPRWGAPAVLALALAAVLGGACTSGQPSQTGPDGGPTGAAGSLVPGGGGNGAGGSGMAGSGGLTGSAGVAGLGGTTGSGGVTGGAGTTGAAGTTGTAGTGPATNVVDGPTGQAFNPVTGMLNVDYAAYLSKHDVVYNTPNTNPLYGLTVGNGRVGAIVWSENGLTMQVSGVDTSQQTAFSAGLVNLSTSPALDAGATKFQQRLSLYDGLLTTTYDAGRTVTSWARPARRSSASTSRTAAPTSPASRWT